MTNANLNGATADLSEIPDEKPYEVPTLSALDFDKTAGGGNTPLRKPCFRNHLTEFTTSCRPIQKPTAAVPNSSPPKWTVRR